jgi:hypothetical protein
MAKRRARGEGALYQRSDGRWVAQVEAGRGENGRRRYIRRVRGSREEARAVLREIEQDLADGIIPDARGTVESFLRFWLETVLYDRAPSTIHTYRSVIDRWINPHMAKFGSSSSPPATSRG